MSSLTRKQGIKNIYLSTAGHFILDMYPAFIVGVIPIIAMKFNLTLFQVAVMTSLSQISNSLTQPLFGYLADRKGFKNFMTYGLLTAAVSLSLIAVAPSYFLILFLLFAGNLGVSAFHPPSAAIGAQYIGRNKGFGNSIISLGGCTGFAVGTFFFILIIEKAGINFSPLAMIPGIIFFFILLKLLPLSNFKKINSLISDENKLKSVKRNTTGVLVEKEKIHVKTRKEKLILLMFSWISAYSRDVLWFGLTTFMPIYFTQAKISILNTGLILMVFVLLGGLGGMLSTLLTRKIKRSILIQIAYIITIPLIFFTFKTHGGLSITLFFIAGFFLISTIPIIVSLSHDLFPGNLGMASSLVIGFSAGFAGITVMLLGKLADKIGIVPTVYLMLIPLLISIISLFFYPVVEKRFNSRA